MRRKTREQKELIQATVEKGRNRPMLIDSYNTGTARSNQMAKLQSLKKFTEIMKQAGHSQKEIDKRLPDNDREILEEDKFLTKQKERYGKSKPKEDTQDLTRKELEKQYGTSDL